jgi:predicted Zn-dependent protease
MRFWVASLAMLTCAAAPDPKLTKLAEKADAVLAVDRPEGRPDVNVVFEAADAFAAAGQLSKADGYYAGGLSIQPHDFEHHLAYAELLGREQKLDLKKVQAGIIVKGCEDGGLVAKAQALIGTPPVEVTPFEADKLRVEQATIVLVPLGDVDLYLLQQEQSRLHEDLGIDVQIHTLPVKLRDPARSTLLLQAEAFRSQLQQIHEKSQPEYSKILQAGHLTEDDLSDDAKALKLFSELLRSAGQPEQAQQIEYLLAHANEQWAAEDMLSDLLAAVPRNTSNFIRVIGVTNEDIFSQKTNFLFGWTQGPCAVVSYRRFMASFEGEVPNRERLLRRFHFQCLSSAGRVFGIPPCTDPTCPRCYPHDLAEEDAKSDRLCDTCRQAFNAAFKLP